MNIFAVDNCPRIAAESLCDKHIPKMVVETYQMLGSALRRHGAVDHQMPLTAKGTPLIGGYKHHPCTRWAGDCRANYVWLSLHGINLANEFNFRFGHGHRCYNGLQQMADMWNFIPNAPQFLTPFAQAMPDEYKADNAVDAYRNYYLGEKSRFAKWQRGRQAPDWWVGRVGLPNVA